MNILGHLMPTGNNMLIHFLQILQHFLATKIGETLHHKSHDFNKETFSKNPVADELDNWQFFGWFFFTSMTRDSSNKGFSI